MEHMIIKPIDTSPQSSEALALHYEIKAAHQAVANALVELSRNLKTMKDKKLYTQLGFEKFEDYVEQAHNIKQRQAYTYIQAYEKLTPKLMAENAELGITKLSLLCQVSAIDREDFIRQNDLAGMSVEQIEALIKEKNGLHEQLSLLQSTAEQEKAVQDAQNKEIDRLKKELAEKNDIIADLSAEQQPIDVAAVETEKIEAAVQKARAEFEKEKADEIKAAVKAERDKAAAKAEKQAQKAAEDAVSKAKEEWQAESKKQADELQAAVLEQKQKAAALEKQLSIKGNDKTVRFSILFEQVQTDLINCLNLINEIADADVEKAEKYKNALKSACSAALGG